jgi:hypothetical protein
VIVMAAMVMDDSSRARLGWLGKRVGWRIPLAGPLGVAAVPAWILAALAGPIAFYVITNEGAKHRCPSDEAIHNPRVDRGLG